MHIRFPAILAAALAILACAGCAATDTDSAGIPRGGNDCFWANTAYNWQAVNDNSLIVWSPGRSCPYHVELVRRCDGIRFTEDIAFDDRDGRICPYGGDAVIVPGPGGDRCSIASITRLSPEEADIYLGREPQPVGITDDAGGCDPQAGLVAPATAPITAEDIGEAEAWGAAKNVVGVKQLWFSSQPDQETLRIARDKGVGMVINFRPAAEMDWDEEQAAAELGLAYYNVPIPRDGDSIDSQSLHRASQLVEQYGDSGILLHCSTGNRAAAWFATHLVEHHGMDVEASIGLARSAGLTSAGMESRVRNYLGHPGQQGN